MFVLPEYQFVLGKTLIGFRGPDASMPKNGDMCWLRALETVIQ